MTMQVARPAVTSNNQPLVLVKAKCWASQKKTTKYLQRSVFVEEEKNQPPVVHCASCEDCSLIMHPKAQSAFVPGSHLQAPHTLFWNCTMKIGNWPASRRISTILFVRSKKSRRNSIILKYPALTNRKQELLLHKMSAADNSVFGLTKSTNPRAA